MKKTYKKSDAEIKLISGRLYELQNKKESLTADELIELNNIKIEAIKTPFLTNLFNQTI